MKHTQPVTMHTFSIENVVFNILNMLININYDFMIEMGGENSNVCVLIVESENF